MLDCDLWRTFLSARQQWYDTDDDAESRIDTNEYLVLETAVDSCVVEEEEDCADRSHQQERHREEVQACNITCTQN